MSVRGFALAVAVLCLTSCGCELASRLAGPVGQVRVLNTDECSGPLFEQFAQPEFEPPWGPGPSSEFGVIRILYDGGIPARHVLFTFDGGSWSRRELSPQIAVSLIGDDGVLCGSTYDGTTLSVAIEDLDGGVTKVSSVHQNCAAYAGGWWAAWDFPRVLRGRGATIEIVAAIDAGIVPGIVAPGVVPAVIAVRSDGETLVAVGGSRPGAWLIPSNVELRTPEGIAAPIGFAGQRPYGLVTGPVLRKALVWDPLTGNAQALDTSSASADFVQVVDLRGHSDGHFCGTLEFSGGTDRAAFWKRDGGFVSPSVFDDLDAGIRPVWCAPVARDWYYVNYLENGSAAIRTGMLRLRIECMNDERR